MIRAEDESLSECLLDPISQDNLMSELQDKNIVAEDQIEIEMKEIE